MRSVWLFIGVIEFIPIRCGATGCCTSLLAVLRQPSTGRVVIAVKAARA
jgi:hypothetical protein